MAQPLPTDANSSAVTPTSSPRRGLLLVGHGTRDAEGTKQFFVLASRLQAYLDGLGQSIRVQPSLLEFQQPDIPAAWNMLIEAGVDQIDVAPLLLFAAGHAKQDIPGAIAELHRNAPQVSVSLARPLSRHPAVMELALQRITSSVENFDPRTTTLVMVGRGSYDPCARSDMQVLSEIVRYRLGMSAVQTCFYAMAEPCLPETLQRLSFASDQPTVVVYSHLLFAGRLYDAIVEQATSWAQQSPALPHVAFSQPLGPEEQIAAAIFDRVQQASGYLR